MFEGSLLPVVLALLSKCKSFYFKLEPTRKRSQWFCKSRVKDIELCYDKEDDYTVVLALGERELELSCQFKDNLAIVFFTTGQETVKKKVSIFVNTFSCKETF